ncbi:CYFA0S02e09956g1_1 [Cyberlindnera fabianii]|uniref:CYFA0S02e09956g1_1 n=1 Tax=Cyberlindnera fabianii TaxID=36022 RepID=A0A061AUH8_CYBFA|nr:CYFA0S02e09956g1_1 [Cyberlindnera fabianii]
MYMPNLIPRDVHHLWLNRDDGPTVNGNSDERVGSSGYGLSAPPLSSYSSQRPGPVNTGDEKLRQLRSIRTFGFSYLAPLGVGKTMQTLVEERELRKQMEEQFQSDNPTVENLMGEVGQPQMNSEILAEEQQGQEQGFEQDTEQEQQNRQQQQQHQTPTQAPLPSQQTPQQIPQAQTPVRDLDDDIPDADDADYGGYDDEIEDTGNTLERQYDRGFMVSEQYEREDDINQDVVEEEQGQGQGQAAPVQFATPMHNNSRLSHLAHSGSMNSIATGASGFESSFEANISMNASDLDMTIDD